MAEEKGKAGASMTMMVLGVGVALAVFFIIKQTKERVEIEFRAGRAILLKEYEDHGRQLRNNLEAFKESTLADLQKGINDTSSNLRAYLQV